MSRSPELLPDAEIDLADAFEWYEARRAGLGSEFLDAFASAVRALRTMPESHELVLRRTRKVLLRRFPYVVLYAVEDHRVLILAVLHTRRDPRRWSERIREGSVQISQHDEAFAPS